MRRTVAIFASAVRMAVFLAATSASAKQDRDWEACEGRTIDARISGCTSILARGSRETQKNRSVALNNRGNAYFNKGEYDRAIEDYNESLRLNPNNQLAFSNRGKAKLAKHEYWDAIQDYSAAIAIVPSYMNAYISRGNAFMIIGKYDSAIQDFSKAIQLKPENADAFEARGDAYKHKGDYSRAIRDFDEAVRINPDHPTAYNNRGSIYDDKNDYDRAIRDFDEAIRINPDYAFAYNNRGNSHFNRRDYDRAIYDFDQAIRLDPAYTAAFSNRGRAFEKRGNVERALADYHTALALPQKFNNGKWAHDFARERLAALGAEKAPVASPSLPQAIVQPAPLLPAAALPQAMPPQPLGRRVALVIGNSAYAAVEKLPNARVDAEAVAAMLRDTGFEKVALETDLTRERLLNVLRSFAGEAEGADWATVYFAGHGVEMSGVNYMIPVDAKLKIDRDLEFEAVPLDRLMSAVDGAKKLRLVMLDACRDNPFLSQMRRSVATRSIGRGLAQVEPEAGTLVVFAAKHGQIALDGEARNSPFVTALVNRIKTPGLEVRRLFDLVRDDVMAATKRRQQPFSYGSVSGSEDFFFVAK